MDHAWRRLAEADLAARELVGRASVWVGPEYGAVVMVFRPVAVQRSHWKPIEPMAEVESPVVMPTVIHESKMPAIENNISDQCHSPQAQSRAARKF